MGQYLHILKSKFPVKLKELSEPNEKGTVRKGREDIMTTKRYKMM